MIYYANNLFDKLKENPFNGNKSYDNKWIMLKLLDIADFKQCTGGGKDGIFRLIITKKNIDWEYRIFDFIQYEEYHSNNIIIAVDSKDLKIAEEKYQGHNYDDPYLRIYEQKILMHTTPKENFEIIMQDKCLKSWNLLKSEKRIAEEKPIGELLGDPLDYSDYIMFSNGGNDAERVVSSKQKGNIEMDLDIPYIAGARFYFDCETIAKDGLLIRDGAHLKVRNRLPLQKYLLWYATPEILGISENTTPRIFAKTADNEFQKKFNIVLSNLGDDLTINTADIFDNIN